MKRSKKPEKMVVPLSPALAEGVRRRTGPRGVAAFVARAVRHELERERVGELLEEIEAAIGPADEKLVAEALALWQQS